MQLILQTLNQISDAVCMHFGISIFRVLDYQQHVNIQASNPDKTFVREHPFSLISRSGIQDS